MTWLSKGTSWAKKTASKGLAFAGKIKAVAENPMQAASKLLQSGAASKSGKPKTPSIEKSSPTKTPSKTMVFDESTWYGKAWIWLKANWYWVIVPLFIAIVIWWYLKKAKKRTAGRRRTFAARRARAATRRPMRRRVTRKK
jgi:hypothetical protein